MKPSFRAWISGCAAVLALVTGSGIQAQDAAKAGVEPMALQGIMHRLGQDMQAVVAAIAIEDWVQVAGLAPKIARHPWELGP